MKKMQFKIERMGSDGEGIAYYQNKPVYIYYTLIDEIVEAELFINKRGSFEANLINVIKPSPLREEVKWKYYMKSGSVNLLHLKYFEQLKYKRNVVNFLLSSKLRRETNKTKVNLTIGSKDILGYRNKTDIPLITVRGKNALANYFRGSNNLFPIDDLISETEDIIKALNDLLPILDEYKYFAYNKKNKKGDIYSISVRSNLMGEVQIMVNTKNKIDLKLVADKLMKVNKGVVSIYLNVIKDYNNNTDVYNGKLSLVSGSKYLEMKLKDLKFYLTPFSFFQLNTNQALVLYEEIIKLGNFKKNDVVLDAYSGVGTIASFISPYVKEVVAIEAVKEAVNDMNYSLQQNNIENVKTISGDLVKMTDYLKSREKFDKVIFDPPRVGLGLLVCNFLLEAKPEEIIYVSCNPKTLVEDLKLLSKSYEIISITPVDMFPQTSQVESITVLKLRSER